MATNGSDRHDLKHRFQALERRLSTWPLWKRLVVFTPVLILLTAVLMGMLWGVYAVLSMVGLSPHH